MALSKDDREQFLAEPHVAALSVNDEAGRAPLTVPIWYQYSPGGEPWVLTGPGSRKHRLIEAAGRFTLVFLAAPDDVDGPEVELTYNWDQADPYDTGRFFGHLAFEVSDIYATCTRLLEAGVTLHRPPRDGRMAFVKSPDGHSVELLQRGEALAPALPFSELPNIGSW